jgi:shikimate dehydrogenase
MRKFGLIGYPLSHSFSQKYFSEKFQREGIRDAIYLNFPLPSIEELTPLIRSEPSLNGLNVTIPYKEKVLAFLDFEDEIVNQTGACNCIKIKNGQRYGFNTDVMGFEQSLMKGLNPGHARALILGTGGASKAVEFVLRKLGIGYRIVSRKNTGRPGLIQYQELDAAIIRSHTLIVNTTPVGMYPNIEECPPIPYQFIGSSHYLFDLVYNPAKTLFLQKGEERGAGVRNGSEMLLIQAEESWAIWNG